MPVKQLVLIGTMLCLLAGGCGYTLQSRATLPFQEVELGRIENMTHEPKLEDRLARALAQVFPEYGIDLSPGARHRIEADITGFELIALSEKSLYVAEYQVRATTAVRIIDREAGTVTTVKSSGPFVTYFRSTGGIESVLAGKERASEHAMRDIAQDIIQRVIYQKYLPVDQSMQPVKTKNPNEPQKAPVGN